MNWVNKHYNKAEYVFAGRAYSEITCSTCGCNGFYIGFDGESFVSKCRDCGNKTMMAKELVKEESEKEAKKKWQVENLKNANTVKER